MFRSMGSWGEQRWVRSVKPCTVHFNATKMMCCLRSSAGSAAIRLLRAMCTRTWCCVAAWQFAPRAGQGRCWTCAQDLGVGCNRAHLSRPAQRLFGGQCGSRVLNTSSCTSLQALGSSRRRQGRVLVGLQNLFTAVLLRNRLSPCIRVQTCEATNKQKWMDWLHCEQCICRLKSIEATSTLAQNPLNNSSQATKCRLINTSSRAALSSGRSKRTRLATT